MTDKNLAFIDRLLKARGKERDLIQRGAPAPRLNEDAEQGRPIKKVTAPLAGYGKMNLVPEYAKKIDLTPDPFPCGKGRGVRSIA